MIVNFDSLNRFEMPKLYLCSPGSKYTSGKISGVAGNLTDTQDEELVLNFNALSELNFRLNRIRREDSTENAFVYNLFRMTQNRRMIFVDDIGFFVVTNVTDGYDGANQYKDVSAKSCEVEIQNKKVPYIEDGTYLFRDLLETVISVVPGWTIGTVDSNVASLYRTFEDVSEDLNCLGFMMENMQDAYECIFAFDCINRTVSVYDQNNYVERTSIHLTKEDLIESINIAENSEDLYTAISVLGDEDLNIAAVNPLGTNVIYNFDYYIPWMSSMLQARVNEWKADIAAAEETYQGYNEDYYTLLEEKEQLEQDIQKLTTQLTMYRRCRDNIIAESSTDEVEDYNKVIIDNGGDAIAVASDIAQTISGIDGLIQAAENEYDAAQSSLANKKTSIDGLKQSIHAIQDDLDINTYFLGYYTTGGNTVVDRSLLNELSNYIFEGNYKDEYIGVTENMSYPDKFEQMKTLYQRAVGRLERVSQPTQEFSIDVDNFLFAKEFQAYSEQLHVGSLINVELEDGDIAELFLSTVTVNYDDCTLSMTFGNRFNKFDPKSLFESALGDIQKSASTLDYVKEILYPIKSGELSRMREYLETSRTLTKNLALSATDQEIVIDDTGYTGRKKTADGAYDDRQVKLTHNLLVFTDDAWDSCKVAIGEVVLPDGSSVYGINTEYLIGDVILGDALHIKDEDGNDAFQVLDDRITSEISAVDGRFTSIEEDAESVSIRVGALESTSGKAIEVRTGKGYEFTDDGLKISDSNSDIANRIDNTGMYVSRNSDNEDMLTVNADGVDAINITTRQYLVIGEHARFEQYGTNRTACFYI